MSPFVYVLTHSLYDILITWSEDIKSATLRRYKMENLLKDMKVCETVVNELRGNLEVFKTLNPQGEVINYTYTLYVKALETAIENVKNEQIMLYREYAHRNQAEGLFRVV